MCLGKKKTKKLLNLDRNMAMQAQSKNSEKKFLTFTESTIRPPSRDTRKFKGKDGSKQGIRSKSWSNTRQ